MQLSTVEARRLAVRAQLLDAYAPESLVEVVDQLTVIQIDPTAAIAPNVDLVSWGRLGERYEHSELTFALERERSLVEFSHWVCCVGDVGLLLATTPGQLHPSIHDWLRENAGFRADVLAALDAGGPLVAAEVPDTCQVPWRSSGWNDAKNVVRMLDLLTHLGDVAVSGRRGRYRTFDLAERVYPADLEVPAADEARRRLDERRLASLGLARASSKGNTGEELGAGSAGVPCTVDGVEGTWYADPAALGVSDPFRGRTALLSPFDRLIHDRSRAEDLFGFEYVLEMYKPAAQRRWGYFALPILHEERLVGKLDARADRKAGVLRVHAIHEDEPFLPEVADSVEAEILALADWLGLEVTREG